MPYFWLNPLSTNLALHLSRLPSDFNFTLYTHLLPIGFWPLGSHCPGIVLNQGFYLLIHGINPFRLWSCFSGRLFQGTNLCNKSLVIRRKARKGCHVTPMTCSWIYSMTIVVFQISRRSWSPRIFPDRYCSRRTFCCNGNCSTNVYKCVRCDCRSFISFLDNGGRSFWLMWY